MSDAERTAAIAALRSLALESVSQGSMTSEEWLDAKLNLARAAFELADGDRILARDLITEAHDTMGQGVN